MVSHTVNPRRTRLYVSASATFLPSSSLEHVTTRTAFLPLKTGLSFSSRYEIILSSSILYWAHGPLKTTGVESTAQSASRMSLRTVVRSSSRRHLLSALHFRHPSHPFRSFMVWSLYSLMMFVESPMAPSRTEFTIASASFPPTSLERTATTFPMDESLS